MTKAVIGIDFGTESCRAVLVDAGTGANLAVHVADYPHGVMERALPSGEPLGDDWALQDPQDYLTVLECSIPQVVRTAGIGVSDIIGIGLDFTSCTMLPVNQAGEPLCLTEAYKHHPHSWVKLWKHHAAKREAEDVTTIAKARREQFLSMHGGSVSSEWMIPKVLEILREDPTIYDATDRFMEAGDWVVAVLTGEFARNVSGAGFKALWMPELGPSPEFFAALDPTFTDVMTTKLRGKVVPVGTRVGTLLPSVAARLGLPAGIAVAAAAIDAFAAVPGCGVTSPGNMVLAMGTSTCHMVLSDSLRIVPGSTGVVKDGILPGFYGYEAGQAAVGDIFAWFTKQCVPPFVVAGAEEQGLSLHTFLEEQARQLRPGESGLLALDWWNGNRSILADAKLSGLFIGLTLATTPAELYRALIEATAFGTKRILEQFIESGIHVTELVVAGGLPKRNKLMMQIYADVTGMVIKVPLVDEPTALGAAMLAAAAAGRVVGGYDTVTAAIEAMRSEKAQYYHPNPKHVEIYSHLYSQYCTLHELFDANRSIMHELRTLRAIVKEGHE